MVYGNWLTGLVFAFIYIYYFNDVIYSDEDDKKFISLIKKYKENNE